MITGDQFLALARQLQATAGGNEPTWRTSTSRAYYGAYHIAREFVQGFLGIDWTPKANSHEYVQQVLTHTKNKNAILASGALASLHHERKYCDYDIDKEVSQSQAALNCQLADQIQMYLRAARNPAAKSQMASEVRRFLSSRYGITV